MGIHPARLRQINDITPQSGSVVYWMSREQRVYDNWSLLAAQDYANKTQSQLIVIFCLSSSFLGASRRQFGFMLRGLEETAVNLRLHNIPFILLKGNPANEIPLYINKIRAGALFTDFDPLRLKQSWQKSVCSSISIPFYEADSHNIIPCRIISQKQEWSAYTLRLKHKKTIVEYMDEFPEPQFHNFNNLDDYQSKYNIYSDNITNYSNSPDEITWLKPGEQAAHDLLSNFKDSGIHLYATKRNDPNEPAQSNFSPYLHFGHISSQRIALELNKLKTANPDNISLCESIDAFLEELIVRKELADNFCLYNPDYDNFEGFPNWAKLSLSKHSDDQREYIYTTEEFESAKTHDILWNACQLEMINSGKMHGYMRMYWAKKILEWSQSPQKAIETAIYLNDKYELDGRDPNGFAGIAWSLGGAHDRPWQERPVFGSVRYMNYAGMKRKFDIEKYIRKHS
jgi:deoxyribodipyrimidine photo-lyase